MQTQDKEVLEFALAACRGGTPAWLVTIIVITGSAPRPAGAMLACTADGRQAGSVSGGCVEEDLLVRLRGGEFDNAACTRVEYGVSAEENARLGLPCGGKLELLLQRLMPQDESWLEPLLEAIGERRCLERIVKFAAASTQLTATEHFTELRTDHGQLRQCFGPRMRMLLVGSGQLAASLAELALAMDYEVLVTDPREDALAQWSGPPVPLLQGMPDDIVREQASDRFSIVLTLTHDPRIDDMALMEALPADTWYVGALGSLRTTAKRLERLRELDIPEPQLQRLHAPVGLDIGSKTPIEIAVAIMAELVALRRGRQALSPSAVRQ